ncbi:MAG TPA: TerB family tellurite resistance protein, partial [Reyranella sp.]
APARDPFGARAVIFALLIAATDSETDRQLEIVRSSTDATCHRMTANLVPQMGTLGPAARLPVLDIALPALRQLSPSQANDFRKVLAALIQADQKVTLFEYCMFKIVSEAIRAAEHAPGGGQINYLSLNPLLPDIATILAALAETGGDENAYDAGMSRLGAPETAERPAPGLDLRRLEQALSRLDQSSPAIKRRLIDAAAHTVAADGVVREEEAELLRAICATLGVPMPLLTQ